MRDSEGKYKRGNIPFEKTVCKENNVVKKSLHEVFSNHTDQPHKLKSEEG